jgi:hypothetical protein
VVERRALPGGPARSMVLAEIATWNQRLAARGLDLAAISKRFSVRTEP